VLRILGRIRDASAELGPPLDHYDAKSAAMVTAQQLGGDERAAGPAADDGDTGYSRTVVGLNRGDQGLSGL
jgi:hypothetical protein